MTQIFTKQQHQDFINKFWIKKNPTKVELDFYKKAEKYINYIKWIPGIKMIWIWNSIAMNCSNKESDIDLYIVSENNRMWIVRIFTTFIFQILWVRKTPKNHAWRFCLSFFSTIDWMDFSSFKIENDIYLYFWIIYFKPLLDKDNTYDLFLEKNKSWANFEKYSYLIEENKKYIKHKNNTKIIIKNLENIKNIILNNIEIILKKIFINKTLNHFNKIWKPYWIIINNNMLKFHNWDIREKIKKELLK